MTRIALIALAIAAVAGATATTAGAMHINMSAPRISGGMAGGSHAFTPRPFTRTPDVSIPIGDAHSPIKRAQKAASRDFCEAIYQCCIKSKGASAPCCNAYNDDKFCPY
jgi:hypothetical protein